MADDREVTIGLRLEAVNGGHAAVGVFVGFQTPEQREHGGGRSKAGTITLRLEEWEWIRGRAAVAIEFIEPLVDDDGISAWSRP